jgi:hypothetical protein
MSPQRRTPMRTRPRRAATLLQRAVVIALIVGGVDGFLPSGSVRLDGASAAAVRRVNVPDLTDKDFAPAIFWMGRVGPTTNYADVRVWHYAPVLKFALHITDRLLWQDAQPSPASLTSWDAVSIYISVDGNVGTAPGPRTYHFVKQLGNDELPGSRAAYRGNGSGWVADSASFTPTTTWRGNGPSDTVWDMGWQTTIEIPFASLGLAQAPAPGTTWGLAIVLHDRDDAAGTAIPDTRWPETAQENVPSTWGQLRFGLPLYHPPTTTVSGVTTVRRGLNDAAVPDAAVGGHTVCGEGLNAWTEWGNANYAGLTQFNIQNQWDIADFMCFSKYFVTFPLTGVPQGRSIVSARVKLSFFGNAGYQPTDAQPSDIDALVVEDDWDEATVTWNNAPYAAENVAVTRVYPVGADHPAGVYEWDVSYAAAQAYYHGKPLKLAFYSTDGDYHSGKYFFTSDSNDWGGTVRPTLDVQWGEPQRPARPTGLTVVINKIP